MPAKHSPADVAARKRWNAANMKTLTAIVKADEAETIKAKAAAEGKTVNAVIKQLLELWQAGEIDLN